jgi:hypothetical protein
VFVSFQVVHLAVTNAALLVFPFIQTGRNFERRQARGQKRQ